MKLRRVLTLRETVLYGVNIILGAGIFVLIGPAAGMAGNALWISFLLAALVASFTGLSYCELSSMFPHSAAEYVYVKKAFHTRFLAFLSGWLVVFLGITSAATVSLGFAGYLNGIFTLPIIRVALVLLAVLSYISYRGMKESSKFTMFLVGVTLLGLIAVIAIGIPKFSTVNLLDMPFGFKGILSAATLIFFAYLGFDELVNISDETRNPKKTISKAIIISLLITTLVYILVSMSAVSLASWQDLSASTAPLAFAASKVMGSGAFTLISITALFTTAGTVLIVLIVTSRMMYGMSKEGSLPKSLSKININTRTPAIAIFTVMALSMIVMLLGDLKTVAQLTSLIALVTFATVNFSLIWLRFKMPKMKREFKIPLNIGKFPILALFGLLSSLVMISQIGVNLLVLGVWVIFAGAIAYFLLRKKIIE
jgi:APA family basic amino acid/polyamine antiporter